MSVLIVHYQTYNRLNNRVFMDFVAIDVETANSDLSSICQIGITQFKDGKIYSQWSSLIDPKGDFDWMNVNVHGINEDAVRGQPSFSDIYPRLVDITTNEVIVCHSSFDINALTKAITINNLPQIEFDWIDSAKVARRSWEQFSKAGYGLANLSKFLGITFNHHDALEDSMACGIVLIRAIEHTGLSINEWKSKTLKPITKASNVKELSLNEDGNHFGEVIVFTGALTLSRRDATLLAMQSGCEVGTSVNKKTTLLVVGDQDLDKLAGNDKSSKHRKAEDLIKKGQQIRILSESDFSNYINK
jgi:DNA polymerase-3 subunit epsilon